MEAQLIEWKATIDGIKAKAQKASAAGRVELQKHAAAFETRYGEVSRRRFEEPRTAGEDEVAAIIVVVWQSIAARQNL
jgi:hypothetical protein